jgi:D-beta-D-heptose 7-phosphate kinase / D-beta-D-heptose 1-phosphate adenosyltransferase
MSTQTIELVEKLPNRRVVLVGDFMIDKYIFGRSDRISPEAPIPVLKFQSEEFRLGGAGFVLAGLTTLGAAVSAVGIVGRDQAADQLRARFADLKSTTDGLVELQDRPTVTKLRLLGSSEDRTPQQMMRLDIEQTGAVDEAAAQLIIERTLAALNDADALCLEDYDKGVLTPRVCKAVIDLARQRKVPVFVDPARLADYSKYTGATLLKLNRPEAEKATGLSATNVEQYRAVAEKLLVDLSLEAVVITLNDQGCYLATAAGEGGDRELLGSRPREVADATGAGDMVLVTLCLARTAGASWHEAAALANVVGGLEVEKLGCVPITRQEIIHDLIAEHHQHAGKKRPLDQLLIELAHHRAAGKRIVFTNGCFDLIHLGHIKYFQFAKRQGDLLVVAVNTDASIQRLKGTKRPIISEEDRIAVLEELQSIDYLIDFDDDTPMRLIEKIRPDVLVKGDDYTKTQVVGWDLVESYGGCVALAPLIDGRSTSAVIQRVLEAYAKE